MDDLISRQAAIDRINKQREHLQPDIYPQDKIGDAAYRICVEFIERLPSAKPMRKKGKWIIRKAPEGYVDYMSCPNCYTEFDRDDEYNFCPNCGCQMMRGDTE